MRPGIWQILICVVIIALLFGANKIPQIARSLGKAKGEFKKGLAEGERDDDAKGGDGPEPSDGK
ncbi:MAG: twin-arginine translocase TatA/TatE family subunit [Kiritimatiellae bacterium]|nr:twin-arginine translocase TatA/TatE family subunit [Kiritimatiellia bacterium]